MAIIYVSHLKHYILLQLSIPGLDERPNPRKSCAHRW